MLPLASQHIEGPARVSIAPSATSGLQAASEIMVHRPQTVSRTKVSRVIGQADEAVSAPARSSGSPPSHATPNVATTGCPCDISIGDAGDISIGDLHCPAA